jgi:copper chaperone
MVHLQVDGMTCGHCERAVERAVRKVDPAARVEIDRAAGRVSVAGAGDGAAIRRAIESEGYVVR